MSRGPIARACMAGAMMRVLSPVGRVRCAGLVCRARELGLSRLRGGVTESGQGLPRQASPDRLLDHPEIGLLLRRHERERVTHGRGAGGTADAVDVIVAHVR